MRKLLLALIVVVVVLAVAGGFVANEMRSRIQEPYKGYSAAEQFVEIPPGAASAEIRRRLLEAGVVSDEVTLRTALWWSGRSRSLQAGSTGSISR
jgi:cell division protein YceG involved in septum cleavage